MKFSILIIILATQTAVMFADTLTVKKDGSGNYFKIQEAIDYAANGDFILVYPGIYYENINFNGKTLMLSSLYDTNPSDSIVNQTIIDGSDSGSCVELISGEQNCFITGFTLQHGTGWLAWGAPYSQRFGGGIMLNNCSLTLAHCFIHDNEAISGGGIESYNSYLNLTGNRIYNNHAYGFGGGIEMGAEGGYSGEAWFDPMDLNSIYFNSAANGYDISKVDGDLTVNTVHLDTGTVNTQNRYYIASFTSLGHPTNNINVIVDHAKIQQVDNDLYVSVDGSDENSGTSWSEPLKTIAFALKKIKSNPSRQNTIWIAAGIYSETATGEKTGFGFKNNVAIIGAGLNKTFVDLENNSWAGKGVNDDSVCIIKKLTFENGSGFKNSLWFCAGLDIDSHNKVLIDSGCLRNMNSPIYSLLFALNDSLIIQNSVFKNNKDLRVISATTFYEKYKVHFKFQNCSFINNTNNIIYDNGQAIDIHGAETLYDGNGYIEGAIVNCLFSDGIDSSVSSFPSTSAISLLYHTTANIVNCTFCNNVSTNQWGAPLGIMGASKANIYNCIFYNNIANQIFLVDDAPEESDTLSIFNSCVENGLDGIVNYGYYNYLFYDSTNISDDPIFLGGNEFPYNLNDLSPCIDAGTLNLPDSIELPATDLAGNPRIVGNGIDMGAYEWNLMVGFSNHQPKLNQSDWQVRVAPNPFSISTHIFIKTKMKATFDIFNQQGILIKSLGSNVSSKFSADIFWDGTDNNGNYQPAGLYLVIMRVNGKTIEEVKVIKN